MILVERGQQWSLHDCLYGNEEEDRKPIKELINLVKDFPNLIEMAQDLEGLIVGRSIHASGVYIFDKNYVEHNSIMKAPNGDLITCWSMAHSDYCGALKVDILTIEALDKIRKCMEILIENGKTEWKGSLRETYDYYLSPDKIDFETKEMWDMLYNGDVINAFQYETPIGQQALKKIQPRLFPELVAGNSLMRLSNKNGEQPLEKYVRFKNDISLWYKEMREDYLLTDEEIVVLEKYLKHLYGVADTQEVVMLLSMDKGIAGFSLKNANKLRKAISKKSKTVLEEVKRMFFEDGLKNGNRIEMLNYVWKQQIEPQLGYSFSLCHTNPYTGILMQEMNLAYHYGHMFWKCACLTVNAGAIGEGKTTDYGKIAKAVSEMNDIVDAPSINFSKEAFTIYNNKILFGLKALSDVGENDIETILNTRPFNSYEDFIEKCGNQLSKNAVVSLIKSGALDEFGNRLELMKTYIESIAEYKKSFSMANIPMLIENGLITEEYAKEIQLYNIYKYICTKPNVIPKTDELKGEWYKIDNMILDAFASNYDSLQEDKDYIFNADYNCYIVHKGRMKNLLDKKLERLNVLLSSSETIDKYNNLIYQQAWDKHARGNIPSWEMASMSYYKTKHELSIVDTKRYKVESFSDLPADPVATETGIYRGREFKRYKLSLIMGTVLDRDKTKHTVSLLTTDGVVTCKLYDGAFRYYDKTISQVNDKGVKKRIEESWFKRGNLLLIYGFRMGDQFKPRKYRASIYQHTIFKINKVNDDGTIIVQAERIRV